MKKITCKSSQRSQSLHLYLQGGNLKALLSLIDKVNSGILRIWDIPTQTTKPVHALMIQYQNLPRDMADAWRVWQAENPGHGDILSTDRRNFETDRWKNCEPFHNLLFPDD